MTSSLEEIQPGTPTAPQPRQKPGAASSPAGAGGAQAQPETVNASRQRWTLLLVAGGTFLATLDLFIVNIAFDKIGADFPGTTASHLSWVLTAYAIVFAALLVPAGRLADRLGRRTLFRLGMIIFTLGSAGCAASPSVDALIAFRVLQASGAALMIPTSLGLLLAAYPPSAHRRIVSAWSAIGTTAAACGPPLGGVLVDVNWRWIFLVNLPVAVPAILAGRLLPSDHHDRGSGLPDFVGSILLVIGIGGVVAGVSEASSWGWSDSKLWACFAVGALGIAAFLARCARHPRPVIDLKLLRVHQFAASNVTTFLFGAGFAGILLGGPLYMQSIWGYSATLAGVAYVPGPITATAVALISARLPITRRVSAIIGCLCFAAASGWWVLALGSEPHYVTHFLVGSILVGCAVGFAMAAMMGVGAASIPPAQYATGTGIINTSRQIGSAVGVAIVVAVVGNSLTPDAFHHAYLITGACALLAAFVATLLTEPPAPAEQAAQAPAGKGSSR